MRSPDIKAVLWDFGGVLTTSPFDCFSRYEAENGLPDGTIRRLNATNPHANAWARYEKGEIGVDTFVSVFEREAADAGVTVDAAAILAGLRTELRPAMLEALRRCHTRLKTGLLTNNFVPDGDSLADSAYEPVLTLFDAVVQSSRVGFRKPDPVFYRTACEMLDVEPVNAVFLDDLGVNLKPAREMGIRTIKVVDPAAALSELQEIVGFPLS